MIRKYVYKLKNSHKDRITWRSHEPLRIEAFSDGVFAFAVSLSVISLEVPHSFKDLLDMLQGFFPFTICFIALFGIWLNQYRFFRRYGLHDNITIVLNAALLLMVLFFIYPLKFLFSSMAQPDKYIITKPETITVLILYTIGAMVISLAFTLMYLNAYLSRDELKLNDIEVFETKTYIFRNCRTLALSFVMLAIFYFQKSKPITDALDFGKLFTVIILTLLVAMKYLMHAREKAFKKKFGNVPVTEPHWGDE